jgi:hypothetical protein
MCDGSWAVTAPLSILLGGLSLAATIALVALRMADRWTGRDPRDGEQLGRMLAEGVAAVAVVLGVALSLLALARAGVLEGVDVTIGSPLMAATICAVIALPLVLLVALARSPQRLVAGLLVAAITMFVLFWPVASGAVLMPSSMPYFTQVLLPTWETAFQFAPGPGGSVQAAVIVGIPIALVFGAAWFTIRAHDARRAPAGETSAMSRATSTEDPA